MSLFNIFTPSWKKQFDELVMVHHNALVSFLQNSYEVYPDMRIDDRIIIEEYKRNYDSSKYPTNINELTNDDKKELVANEDLIIRLAKTFSKYDSPEKRVKSLYNRFRMNGIFDSVFKNILGYGYDINNLSASQIEYVINGYDTLVEKASCYNENKQEKQRMLKEKLMTKVYERNAIALVNKQKNSDRPMMLSVDNNVLRDIIKKKIEILKSQYSEFSVYKFVRRILLLEFENFPEISKDIYILSKEHIFEESFRTFSMIKQFPVRQKYLPLYLMSTNTKDSLEKLFLNHDFDVLDEYAHNELQQLTCSWIESQNKFNENIIDIAKSIMPELRCPKVGTYVTIVNNDNVKELRRFLLVHLMLREFINLECALENNAMSLYTTYITSERYRNMIRHFDESNPSTSQKILNLLLTLKSKIYDNLQFVVILGPSNSVNEKDFNKYHFKGLIDKLTQKYVRVIEFSDIDKIHAPKYVAVLDLFTEVKAFKENCKKILYKFPGVSICYLSIYNEMTKKRYEEYQKSSRH